LYRSVNFQPTYKFMW